jgi:hypothetical protein
MINEQIDDIVQKLIALRRDEFANGTTTKTTLKISDGSGGLRDGSISGSVSAGI